MEKLKKLNFMGVLPYIGLIFVISVFYITSSGRLFQSYNIRIVIQQTVALGIICLGAVFVYSLGNMDISVGACLGLCTLIIITIVNATGNLLIGFLAALALALSFGLVNGAVSAWLGLPSVVTSLFLMFLGSGLQTIITIKTNTITSDYDFTFWKETSVQILTLVILAVILNYVFNYTKIGRYTCSIGANKECAQQSGINVFKYKIYAYLTMGFCISVASIFVLARTGSSSRLTGNGYHMDVMVALILGGMPLSGGMKSKISAALIGAFTYVLLTNGLTLSGVKVNQVPIVKALIFAIIVILTCRKKGNVLPR
ncbi:ABC transporter permease [Anaerocolumna cellulosilytica]|nr:ABC transporter permease [Anaerocolumna cellulosilytica]MBB5194812.1 ribose transport system permease protein [Anaerocolumna cellulosilytica]